MIKPVDIIKLVPLQFENVQELQDEDKASESSVSVSSSSQSETEKYPRIVQPVEDEDGDQRALNEQFMMMSPVDEAQNQAQDKMEVSSKDSEIDGAQTDE